MTREKYQEYPLSYDEVMNIIESTIDDFLTEYAASPKDASPKQYFAAFQKVDQFIRDEQPDVGTLEEYLYDDNHLSSEFFAIKRSGRRVQSAFEDGLPQLISLVKPMAVTGEMEVVDESQEYYYLADKTGRIRDTLSKSSKRLPKTLLRIHTLSVLLHLGKPDEWYLNTNNEEIDFWIIEKPTDWYQAQWTTILSITGLLERGLTANEALVYYFCIMMGGEVNHIAKLKGTTKAAVYNALSSGGEKINESKKPANSHTYDTDYLDSISKGGYFDTVFQGFDQEDYQFVTKNGGVLDPHHEVAYYAEKCRLNGESHASTKQLAVAILTVTHGPEKAVEHAEALAKELGSLVTETDYGWFVSRSKIVGGIANIETPQEVILKEKQEMFEMLVETSDKSREEMIEEYGEQFYVSE